MKRLLLGVVSFILLTASVSAQEPLVEIVYGPLDGDHAGTLYAYPSSSSEVDVWIKTAPGISILGFHFPLSSNDEYIADRNGIFYDFSPTDQWYLLFDYPPNDDPIHNGFTNQSFLG